MEFQHHINILIWFKIDILIDCVICEYSWNVCFNHWIWKFEKNATIFNNDCAIHQLSEPNNFHWFYLCTKLWLSLKSISNATSAKKLLSIAISAQRTSVSFKLYGGYKVSKFTRDYLDGFWDIFYWYIRGYTSQPWIEDVSGGNF